MAFFNSLSLRLRLILIMGVMLFVIAASVGAVGNLNIRQVHAEAMAVENQFGLRSLVHTLSETYPQIRVETDDQGDATRIVWPTMPANLPFDTPDTTLELTGLHPSVFRADAESGRFVRISTTLTGANGGRAVGTEIPLGEVHSSLGDGRSISGAAEHLGQTYQTAYQPIFDTDGSVVGAISMAFPMSELVAARTGMGLKMMAVALVIFGIMMAAGFVIIRVLLRPLQSITTTIVSLSEGNLDDEIGFSGRHDEVGAIAQSLQILQASMREAEDMKGQEAERMEADSRKQAEQTVVVEALSKGLARLSELDLTTRIENTPEMAFPAEYDALRISFNQLVDQLSDTMEAIREASEEVNSDARELAGSSTDLSHRTETQAATLQESAAALEELRAFPG